MPRTASIYQWRIAVIIQALRKAKGWSVRQAADRCHIQKSRLERIESADNQKSDPSAIVGLGRMLGGTAELLDELEELAIKSRDPDASGYNSPLTADALPSWLTAFATIETEAVTIDAYQSLLIPGPLQIPEYMDFISTVSIREKSLLAANKELKIRRSRETLNRAREGLCHFRYILDEAALLRTRGTDFHDAQMSYLCEASSMDHLSVEVVPCSRGAHPSMSTSYRILTFPEDYSPDLVYLESGHDGRYEEARSTLERYRELFSATQPYCVSIKEHWNDAG